MDQETIKKIERLKQEYRKLTKGVSLRMLSANSTRLGNYSLKRKRLRKELNLERWLRL